MAAAGAKEDTFDIWMKQESDTVQALGMAYAERETIEACYRVIQEVVHSVLRCAALLHEPQAQASSVSPLSLVTVSFPIQLCGMVCNHGWVVWAT